MVHARAALALVLGGASCAEALGSGGLYGIRPQDGQMQYIDWTTGSAENFGPSLQEQGWSVDVCAPAITDDALKFYFTLGRELEASATAPWSLLTIALSNGSLVSSQPLPATFPPSLQSCDHAVAVHLKGSLDTSKVFVSAAASQNLTVVTMSVVAGAGPGPQTACSAPLSSIGLGQGSDFPRGVYAALDELSVHWHVLERGLAGCNSTSGTFDQILEVPEGSKFAPLHFNHGCFEGGINGLVSQENGTHIGSFDPCHGAPLGVQLVSAGVPDAAKKGTAAAVLFKESQVAIQADTMLHTVDLQDGSLKNSVQVCEAESATGMGCFSSFAYLNSFFEVSV